jgi:hypothetical protein
MPGPLLPGLMPNFSEDYFNLDPFNSRCQYRQCLDHCYQDLCRTLARVISTWTLSTAGARTAIASTNVTRPYAVPWQGFCQPGLYQQPVSTANASTTITRSYAVPWQGLCQPGPFQEPVSGPPMPRPPLPGLMPYLGRGFVNLDPFNSTFQDRQCFVHGYQPTYAILWQRFCQPGPFQQSVPGSPMPGQPLPGRMPYFGKGFVNQGPFNSRCQDHPMPGPPSPGLGKGFVNLEPFTSRCQYRQCLDHR